VIPCRVYESDLIVVEGSHENGILNEESAISGILDIRDLGLESGSP
jgi:hypothetical protein